ncbi:hypothetical protein SVIOM74S_01587 [Streptomyces violarus]
MPVCKGNGYGFGHERLAEEATRLGSDVLAVGTTYEAARIKDWFGGNLLVLTPYRRGEEPVPLPDRVIRSVSSIDGVYGLVGARVVIEVMSSMKRHGIGEQDLSQLHAAIENIRLEGFAIHLPLDRTDGSDAVEEVIGWMDRGLRAAGCLCTPCSSATSRPRNSSGSSSSSRRRGSVPASARGCGWGTTRPPSTAARSWTSRAWPRGSASATGSRRRPPTASWWSWRAVRRTGWAWRPPRRCTASCRAPRASPGPASRRSTGTFLRSSGAGKQRWFAEPPHMQVSILFVPADAPEPKVGEELVAHLRHTTTQFDRLMDR